jgi:nucleoside-diphosphate-sugar epimerase
LESTKKNIIVTGITSYLGTRLIPFLDSNAYNLICIIREKHGRALPHINNATFITIAESTTGDLEQKIKSLNNKIAGTLHLATCYGRNRESSKEMLFCNVTLPEQLLTIAGDTDQKWFINIDTCLPENLNEYALSKSKFRNIFKSSKVPDLLINIPVQQFYGPADGQLFSNFAAMFNSNQNEIPCSSGTQKRDFVYIRDLVEGIETVLRYLDNSVIPDSYLEFPIGTSNPVSLKDALTLFKELANANCNLKFGALAQREGEPDILSYESKELRALGWKPRYSLEEGLRELLSK